MGLDSFKTDNKSKGKNSYSKEQLLKLLKDKADDLGRSPRYDEMNADQSYPSGETYRRRFGSFNKALAAAGLNVKYRGSVLDINSDSDYHVGYVIGASLADASLSQGKVQLNVKDYSFAKAYEKSLMRISDRDISFYKDVSFESVQGLNIVRICSITLSNALKSIRSLDIDAYRMLLYSSSEKFKVGLLSGMWDGDGGVRINCDNPDITFTNSRENILELYIWLLDVLDIVCSEYMNIYRDDRGSGTSDIQVPREYNRRFLEVIKSRNERKINNLKGAIS